MTAKPIKNESAVSKAQYHAWFHHNDADGYITVAKKMKSGQFRQYHYPPQKLADQLSKWLGEDVFFSQNTFYKPQRKIENIRQLRSLYVDLDFYLFNYDPSWVVGKLEHEFYGQVIPEPNIIIFSGQGIVLIWLLEPVPHQALPLWQAVQNYFVQQLAELGGDSKATDAARIFRIAGSINSKNGVEVHAEYRHEHKYELRQIQYDFLPELNNEINPKKEKKKGRKNSVAHLFNVYRLHHARLLDLVKIVELRDYEVTGYRELICFLYRYWSCCYTHDPDEALNQTRMLNLEFTFPLPENELIRATKSAEKAWNARNDAEANRIAQEQGYPAAGYNLKNSKIIDWLDITSEEMTHLQTIIDGNEKRRRKRERDKSYQVEKRRERGDMKREEYIKQQQDKTDDKLLKLQELLEKNPNEKQKELAQQLGVSDRHIRRLLKRI